MNILLNNFLILICSGVLMLTIVGCEREGPAERAGERIDRGVERAGDRVEDATER